MKKNILYIIFACIIFTPLCSAQPVRIAAAANLRYVLDSIKSVYMQQHKDVTIEISYGASGILLQQILNGAQFHLFMSADKVFPERLQSEGAASGDIQTYAYGKLVLWSNSLDVSKGIRMVTNDSVKHIAIAKPELAPYGDRAIQTLKYYKLYDNTKNKIVFADNISQAAQYASTGNAEVGFLALSIALSPEMNKGNYVLIDRTSYTPIEQACVLVKTWERNSAAKEFMKFLLSGQCKHLFELYGYDVPKN